MATGKQSINHISRAWDRRLWGFYELQLAAIRDEFAVNPFLTQKADGLLRDGFEKGLSALPKSNPK